MKVLADRHHTDLYRSLILLFENRLGWNLYRPIGMEWYHEGYWKVYDHPATAAQFLGIGLAEVMTIHGESATTVFGKDAVVNRDATQVDTGLYRIGEEKGITLDAAKAIGFDIILSSTPAHFFVYEKFRQTYCPHAKHIFQMGNNWAVPAGAHNVLNSTRVSVPAGVNHVFYHQEFELDQFDWSPPEDSRRMINMMHYQQGHRLYQFNQLAQYLREMGWTVMDHGAGNAHGSVDNVYSAMRETGWLWHNKVGGEGYGFNIHHATAMGRPVVCDLALYRGMTAELVLEDRVSCLDMANMPISSVADEMEMIVQNQQHVSLARSTWEKFRRVVDFDEECEKIKVFMKGLQ